MRLTFYCYVIGIIHKFKKNEKLKDVTIPVKWKADLAAELTHSSNEKLCKPFY